MCSLICRKQWKRIFGLRSDIRSQGNNLYTVHFIPLLKATLLDETTIKYRELHTTCSVHCAEYKRQHIASQKDPYSGLFVFF